MSVVGRPFRESIRENKGMYWGLVSVAAIAFSCSTEFIPELNEKLRLVKFSEEFKVTMTITMALDYALCWIIEKALKYMFSDYRPKVSLLYFQKISGNIDANFLLGYCRTPA